MTLDYVNGLKEIIRVPSRESEKETDPIKMEEGVVCQDIWKPLEAGKSKEIGPLELSE